MKLQSRVTVVFWIAASALVLGLLLLADLYRLGTLKALVVSGALVLLVLLLVQRLFVRRVFRRLRAAAAAFDAPEMRRALGEIMEYYRLRPRLVAAYRVSEASSYCVEERWAEARARLDAIDPAPLDEKWALMRKCELGLCLANLGEHDAALALAREVQPRVDRRTAQFCEGRLGWLFVLVGRPGEAVPLLERGLAIADGAAPRATRSYYLGEALRALGRADQAQDAYRRAVEAHPDGRYGRRAQARLDEPKQPYR